MGALQDFVVPPRSWDNIHSEAEKIRSALRISDLEFVPIVDVVELMLDQQLNFLRLEFGTHEEMDGAEGFCDPKGEFIQLREDVYKAAVRGDGRARFTIAHELGHFVLHNNIPMQRKPHAAKIASYKLGEPQANQFAAEFLMPRKFIKRGATRAGLMAAHGVSETAASNRIDFMRSRNLI